MSSRTQVLQDLLEETETHQKIKETIKLMCLTKEKTNYHAHVSSSETYLQIIGLSTHNYDQFNYINKMLHSSMTGVLGRIKRKQVDYRDLNQEHRQLQAQKFRRQNQPSQQIVAEVQHVLNNIDLPTSLFKRNDRYWYHDNPKTIEAKQYVHHRRQVDRERKQKIRAERKQKKSERQKKTEKRMEKQRVVEEKKKNQYHQNIKKRIQQLKQNTKQRQKNIEESQKFYLALKPMFKKIQRQYNNHQLSALQEQKRRMTEVRQLRKSIDLSEIEEHKKKLDQYNEERDKKKILNQPMKVSFKSKYHTSMTSRSRVTQYDVLQNLYEKKKDYGKLVKKQHVPQISQKLAKQMEERLKLMKMKRVRKNPKKGETKDENDSDYDEEEEEEKQEKPVKIKQPNSDGEYQDDQDDDEEPKRQRGEDEDPDRKERYQMGLQYLDYVRNLRKKPQEQVEKMKQEMNALIEQDEKRERQKKLRPRYTDYLKEYQQTKHRTIDHLDTSRMKMSYHKSIIGSQFGKITDLDNEARKIQEKTKHEQQLLKHKRMKKSQAIEKKIQIDNAVVDTIKARLALMG